MDAFLAPVIFGKSPVPNERSKKAEADRVEGLTLAECGGHVTKYLDQSGRCVVSCVGDSRGQKAIHLWWAEFNDALLNMNCEELQLNIALHDDDVLSESERERLDDHLQICPLCRLRLVNNREVVRELHRQLRPEVPAALQNKIRAAIAAEVGAASITGVTPSVPRRTWIQTWLMPSTVGSFATVLIGLTVLSSMFTRVTVNRPGGMSTGGTVFLNTSSGTDTIPDSLTPSEYARQRLDVSGESPSINPNGALVALTKSMVRGEMKDDEVVVVAEVFGNGLARVDEVVEPSHDRRAVEQLQKALQSDPAYAPFVPAKLDGRSDSVRVVLRIQSVDVDTRLPSHRKL